MARRSVKENKNMYQLCREAQGLTREGAAELLETINEDRIERIEGGKKPRPDEIVLMAEKYQAPQLCNYYCVNECDIGRLTVPEVQEKPLSQITVEMLVILNRLSREKDRLLEIVYDGEIADSEIPDFVSFRTKLDDMANTISSLKLWVDQKLNEGAIDRALYEKTLTDSQDTETG